MVDVSWTVHTSDTTQIIADGVLVDPDQNNTITRGETAEYVFTNVAKTLTVGVGTTYTIAVGETERYDFVVVNGTLEINGTLECDEIDVNGTVTGSGTLDVNDQYAFELADVEPYSTYAGKFSITETLGSQQRYNELLPSNATIDTLLVGVEPTQRLQDKTINGYWGLIENISDNRNRPLSNSRIGLEMTVLAPYDEYADHTAVQNDLETTL